MKCKRDTYTCVECGLFFYTAGLHVAMAGVCRITESEKEAGK